MTILNQFPFDRYERFPFDRYGRFPFDRYERFPLGATIIPKNVIRRPNVAIKPVECKAVTGNAKSLKTVMKHPEKYHLEQSLKLGDYNVGRSDYILTLPMYMAFLLTEL